MAARTREPKGVKALEIKYRGLALEDGLWEAAEALAAQAGAPAKPQRLRKSSAQFPFQTALAQQLRAMEARFGALLDGAPEAMLVTSPTGELILANTQAARQFGYDGGALVGLALSTIVGGPAVDALAAGGVEAAIKSVGENAHSAIELVGIRRDSSRFPVEALLSQVAGDEGPMLVVALRDISARKTADRRRSEAQAHQRNLLDLAPDALVVVNKRGRIVLTNRRMEQVFGLSHGEFVGRPAGDVLPPDLARTLLAAVVDPNAVENLGETLAHKGTRRDGTTFPMETRIGLVRDEYGCVALASVRDLSRNGTTLRRDVETEDLHRRLFDAAPDATVVVDARGMIVSTNHETEHRFGYERHELIGHPVTRLLPGGLDERLSQDPLGPAEVALARAIGAGIELIGRRKDGTILELEATLATLAGDDPLTIATLRDAALRRGARRPAAGEVDVPRPARPDGARPDASLSHMAEVTLDAIGDALISADLSGNVSFINRVAEQLTGWTWAEASGRPLREILTVVDAGTRITVHDVVAGTSGPRRVAQLHPNIVLVRRDGAELPIEGSIAPIEDKDGRLAGRVLIFRDVSLARARADQMAYVAQHDALTGLPNRVLLSDRIGSAIAIAPRHNKKVAVLFLDLDGFKRINDSLGHAVGDKLLQVAAGRLMGCVRGSDTVSRIGGDEFVVVLSEVERPEDSAISARRMLEALAQPYAVDGHELRVTASIGVAVYPEDGLDAESLIKSADAAMYQAKENGRHGYQFYKPSMNLRAVERQEVEDGLRRAIEREEFTLYFQPKVNLHTGEISGAEALLRWEHPSRGPVPPSLFMPIAETSGLIQPIGNWVMREACRQAAAWQQAGLRLPSIAVNVSAIEFAGTKFLDGVFDILNGTGLDPRALELELTESVLMRHAESSNAILQALRAGGVQMSVDDFGTGYSSLSYLRKFPIHMLKIDQSFVREITASEGDASVVTAVLNMAQSLNLRVVAEGVETSEELAFLQRHRCDEAQGFYFSRPLPAPEFQRLLRNGLLRTMAARRTVGPAELQRRDN